MATLAIEGQKALAACDYPKAIELYTRALNTAPSPTWLTQRSIAFQRNKQYEEALVDAESAILLAISRGRREHITTAQMRRAIALHGLKRYGDARLCLTWVRKWNDKEKGLGIWQEKVKNDYENLPQDDPGRKVILKEQPDEVETAAKAAKFKETEFANLTVASAGNPAQEIKSATSVKDSNESSREHSATSLASSQTPREKIRQEWFQSSNKVAITVFAKNVPKASVDVEFDTTSVFVSFPTGTPGIDYNFKAMPLFSTIDVSQSSYSVTTNKIEINLQKKIVGLKWSKLEGDESTEQVVMPVGEITAKSSQDKAPGYPTSSRTGPKNWDALSKQALKDLKIVDPSKENDQTTSGNKETGEAGNEDSDDEGDAIGGFFKKLYKGADPDSRRAMMKSYTESNGTTLSTNWADVAMSTQSTSPPKDVEEKKWT